MKENEAYGGRDTSFRKAREPLRRRKPTPDGGCTRVAQFVRKYLGLRFQSRVQMPARRRDRMGRSAAAAHQESIRALLSLYRKRLGSSGFNAGSVPAGVPDDQDLPFDGGLVRDLVITGDAEPFDR